MNAQISGQAPFDWLHLFSGQGQAAQGAVYYDCPDESSAPVFKGEAGPTLCEQYPEFTCQLTVGTGTGFPTSSSLGSSASGNICVVGDFLVDAPFSFVDAVVKVDPGVKIEIAGTPNGYTAGSSLLVNNSKLFACEGLWAGIVLGPIATIVTSNNTEIEDAERAIFASGLTGLSIDQTTFNRNRVGVELDTPFPNPWVPGPVVWSFSRNHFTCDAPLNGTASEITQAGVKLNNSVLYALQPDIMGINRFSDLEYGVYATGTSNLVSANYVKMERIQNTGIYIEEGSLSLGNSSFDPCELHGIAIGTARSVYLDRVTIVMPDSPSPIRRTGIDIGSFDLNAEVDIQRLKFDGGDLSQADEGAEAEATNVTGLHLNSTGPVLPGTKIKVGGNSEFGFSANASYGILISGDFPESSLVEVHNSHFRVSALPTLVQGGQGAEALQSNGERSNLSVNWNTFSSYAGQSVQANWGLAMWNSLMGTGNEASYNNFNSEVQSMAVNLFVQRFANGVYSDNLISGFSTGFSTSIGAYFAGPCFDTDFRCNTFEFAGNQALFLAQDAIIGKQEHKGNTWYGYTVSDILEEAGLHALYAGNAPQLNQFVVHTAQSTCTNESASCFSPYYPRLVSPAVDFFKQLPGAPPSDCDAAVAISVNSLDLAIAQGQFAPPAGDPSMGWVLQRQLYRKLMRDSSLAGGHAALAAFMSAQAGTTVGQFDAVYEAVQQGLQAAPGTATASQSALAGMDTLLAEAALLETAIEQQGGSQALYDSKRALIAQAYGLQSAYDSLSVAYRSGLSQALQQAYTLNQGVAVQHSYEANQKAVNEIYLLSLMQQGGKLTEAQVAALQGIAGQDPKQGGPAMHTARGLLPACAKPEAAPAYAVPSTGQEMAGGSGPDLPIELGAAPDATGIAVFPNPASATITVRSAQAGLSRLTLMDLSGKVWLERALSGTEAQVEIGQRLPAGLYLVRAVMEDGAQFTEKLVVQH